MLKKCYFEQVLLCDSVNTEKSVIYYSIMWVVMCKRRKYSEYDRSSGEQDSDRC